MRKELDEVYMLLDVVEGPLDGYWDEERRVVITFTDVVDNDPVVFELQRLIIDLYYPLWKAVPPTDENHSGLEFDFEREKELAPVLLYLLKKLKARLEEINDGSYEIRDSAIPYLERVLAESEGEAEEKDTEKDSNPPAPKREFLGAAGAKPDPAEEKAHFHFRKGHKDLAAVWLWKDVYRDGRYGMPALYSGSDISEIDYIALYSRPSEYHKTENTAVCFYEFDIVFDGKNGLYNAIKYQDEKALARFKKRFEGVNWIIAPDYSLIGDHPLAEQIDNVYRSRLVGAWLNKETGAEIIPNVRFTTEKSFDFAFDGIPAGSNIALGMLGLLKEKENRKMFDEGFPALIDKVRPNGILVHGFITEDNIEDIFGYALERGTKIVVPHSSLDRLKGPNAFYGTKEPFGDIGE